MLLYFIPVLIVGYILFLIVKVGLHQRLFLALGPISLEHIPDRAARKYGERILFTTDTPCRWEVPGLRERYGNVNGWSAARIRSTAGYLASLLLDQCRLQTGDRVAIFKKNHLDIHVFHCAVVRAGGIACPINDNFPTEKLLPYLLNIDARLLISDLETVLRVLKEGGGFGGIQTIILAQKKQLATGFDKAQLSKRLAFVNPELELLWLEEALAGVDTESKAVRRGKQEPLYLVHSSGTTGFPKAVILKNGPQSHAVRGWLCYVHLSRRGNKGYLAVPNNHQAVILSFNSLLLLGLPVHWIASYAREGFDAEQVIRELAEGGYTGYFGFPITYTQLKEIPLEDHDLSRMKFWASTADASHEAIMRRFVKRGNAFRSLGLPIRGSVFLDAQGSSEVGTPSVIRYVTPFTRRFGRRIGRPGSTPFGPRIRITGSDGRHVRPGEAGRLEVKGKTVFAGYWNNHELTCKAFRDGWFFTGDVVRRADDGHLVQLDREVDVIRTARGDVYSLPMEEKIHKHPAVYDVCVYGERQPDGRQLPAAVVALRDGFETPGIRFRMIKELNAILDEQEQLNRVQLLEWNKFPLGVTGKTLKRVFREMSEPGEVTEQNRPVLFRAVSERFPGMIRQDTPAAGK